MRIGELAKRAGVSRDTIRYYERRGLLPTPSRTEAPNGYAHYPEKALRRLGLIRYAKQLGFSLAEVAPHLDEWEAGRLQSTTKVDALKARLVDIVVAQEALSMNRMAVEQQLRDHQAFAAWVPPLDRAANQAATSRSKASAKSS